MTVQITTFRNLLSVAGLLLVFMTGCDADELYLDTATGPNAGQYIIRVLLDDKVSSATFRVDSPYQIASVDTTEVSQSQNTGENITTRLQTDGIKVGPQLYKTKKLIIAPRNNSPFIFNSQAYRGSLEFIINDDGNSMMVINNVTLETYLAGVVSAEMPGYWEAEALKAQAVAARTYCLYIKARFGKNRNWDVKATQANQVYKGVAAETVRTINAVNATAGMVLCCEGESGTCEMFPAYYGSICGGHTENAQDVFGESWPALKGVDCPYCRQITRPGIFYWPIVSFDKQYVTDKLTDRYPNLKDLGQIEKIEVVKENTYDSTVLRNGYLPTASTFKRIVAVKLIGSAARQPSKTSGRDINEPNSPKTAYLRAEDLRLAIDPTGSKIQSTSCIIVNTENEFMFLDGKGFGHGVGLCQYGTRQMARDGKTAEQILAFYYPTSRIKILY